MIHTAHLYEIKSWRTLCGDETGKLMGKPLLGDKVQLCEECDRVSQSRLKISDHQPYKNLRVPAGMQLAALRRYTDDRKFEFYDASISHPGNVDKMLNEVHPGKGWEPLFVIVEGE